MWRVVVEAEEVAHTRKIRHHLHQTGDERDCKAIDRVATLTVESSTWEGRIGSVRRLDQVGGGTGNGDTGGEASRTCAGVQC